MLGKIANNFYHAHQGQKPIAGIDISNWIYMCLKNPTVVVQYHADPKVPMTAVSDYVMKKINLFLRNKWELFVVFDCQRHQLKAETNETRKGELEEDRRRLDNTLRNSQRATAAQVQVFLRSRGVQIPKGATRDAIEVMVDRVRRLRIDALPKACFRGGGGYFTWAPLSPIEETNEAWLAGNAALEKLRSFPLIYAPESTNSVQFPSNEQFVTETLSQMHNSRQLPCLMHVQSGSFDPQTVSVSLNLESDACPTKRLFVVKAECAPVAKK